MLSTNVAKTGECFVFRNVSANAGQENNSKLAYENIEKP